MISNSKPRLFLKCHADPRGVMIAMPTTYELLIKSSSELIAQSIKQSNNQTNDQTINQIIYPCLRGARITENIFPYLRDNDIIIVHTPETISQVRSQTFGPSSHFQNNNVYQQSNNQTTKQSINQSLNNLHIQSPTSPSKKRPHESNNQSNKQSNKSHKTSSNGQTTRSSSRQATEQSNKQSVSQSSSQSSSQSNNQSIKSEVRGARDDAILIDDDDDSSQQSNNQTTKRSTSQSSNQSSNGTTTSSQSNNQSINQSSKQTAIKARVCASPDCDKPAQFGPCPDCVKRNKPDEFRYFCNQECFIRNWQAHTIMCHK